MPWSSWSRLTVAVAALTVVPLLDAGLAHLQVVADAQLAEARGLDAFFTKFSRTSCGTSAASALRLTGGPPVPDRCDDTSIGATIAGCTTDNRALVGRLGVPFLLGTGDDNMPVASCGFLRFGECQQAPIPMTGFVMENPTVLQIAGAPVLCDKLLGVKRQSGPGGVATL